MFCFVWISKIHLYSLSDLIVTQVSTGQDSQIIKGRSKTLAVSFNIGESEFLFLDSALVTKSFKLVKLAKLSGKSVDHMNFVEEVFDLQSDDYLNRFVFWVTPPKTKIRSTGEICGKRVESMSKFTEPTSKDGKENVQGSLRQLVKQHVFLSGKGALTLLYGPVSHYKFDGNAPIRLIEAVPLFTSKDWGHVRRMIYSLKDEKKAPTGCSLRRFLPDLPSPYKYLEISDFHWNLGDQLQKKRAFEAIHLPSGKKYMIDVCNMDECYYSAFKDWNIMLYLGENPFVEKCCKIIQEGWIMYIITECAGEDLSIMLNRKCSEDDVKFYVAQILLGLKDIHDHALIHKEITLENCKIAPNGYIKVSGMKSQSTPPNVLYLSPEYILNGIQSKAMDYWSLGVIIYQILFGGHPFSYNGNERENILNQEVEVPVYASPKCKDFVEKLLTKDPFSRLGKGGLDDVIKHPWFASFDWDSVKNQTMKAPYVPKVAFLQQESKRPHLKGKIKEPKKYAEKYGIRGEVIVTIVSQQQEDVLVRYFDGKWNSIVVKMDDIDIFTMNEEDNSRLNALREIIKAQRENLQGLNVLIEHFYGPLQKILSPNTFGAIFGQLSTIVGVNTFFINDLEILLEHPDKFKEFVKLLAKNAPMFKLYLDFIQNYAQSLDSIEQDQKKNVKFAKFLKSKGEELLDMGLIGNLGLYMTNLLHILPKFKLLMEDMYLHTPKDEQEEFSLAISALNQTVAYLMQKFKEIENKKYLFAIQNRYGLPEIQSQKLILEKKSGDNIVLTTLSKMDWTFAIAIFVFSDLLFIRTEHKDFKFELKDISVPLVHVTDHEHKNYFFIGIRKGNEAIVLRFQSHELWSQWMSVFSKFKFHPKIIII